MSNFKNELRAWQQVPRDLICDNTLSDRARFVYCFMACKPDNWDFYMKPLADDLGYSVDTLRKYINELEKAGWLTKGDQNHDLEEGKKKKLWGAREYILHAQKVQRESDTENFRHGKNPTQDKRYNRDNRDREKEYEEINSSYKKKDEKTWRDDFDIFLRCVYEARDKLLQDKAFRGKIAKYYPNADYDKTINAEVDFYWGTEIAWEKRKKGRSKSLDMVKTLKNNFKMNIIYKPRSFKSQEQDEAQVYHSKKRDALAVYNDYISFGTERYRGFMVWLAKNAEFVYERYTTLMTVPQFESFMGETERELKFLDIIKKLNSDPIEREKHDNLYEYVKENFNE